MWLFVFIFFGPFIYLVVSMVVDGISDKVNEISRKKYYGYEEVAYYTTYNNDNITKEDIMLLFINQVKKYRKDYYNIDYKVFNGKDEQNYAWSISITKQTFGWGIIYYIRYDFSNGWFYVSFSNRDFISGGQSSQEYYLFGYDIGSGEIEKALDACKVEAIIKWKINGMKPEAYSPFDYIPFSDSNRTSQKNAAQFDLISFYRNLLGLRMHFSHEELKRSYREAVGKYHPDRYGASSPRDRQNAEMLMKQVNEAYEKLKAVAE